MSSENDLLYKGQSKLPISINFVLIRINLFFSVQKLLMYSPHCVSNFYRLNCLVVEWWPLIRRYLIRAALVSLKLVFNLQKKKIYLNIFKLFPSNKLQLYIAYNNIFFQII